MYFAVLPQFISPDRNAAIQAIMLSSLFIVGCGLVYGMVGLMAASAHGSKVSVRLRRRLEAVAGLLLAGAAIKIAS